MNWRVYYIAFQLASTTARLSYKFADYWSGWACDLEIMFSQAWAEKNH